MKATDILTLPLRLFIPGTGLALLKKKSKQQKRVLKAQSSSEDRPQHRSTASSSGGWLYGDDMADITALLLTSAIIVFLIAMLEGTYEFQTRFGYQGLTNTLAQIGLTLPSGPKWQFYQSVLARAICTSEISLVQTAITCVVLFLGFRLVLISFAIFVNGCKAQKAPATQAFMSLSIILMPGLGILSTCIGILSANQVTQEAARYIIFGPSSLGVIGFLLANTFYSLAEYVNEQ